MQASIRWFGWVRSSWSSTWPSRGRSRLDLTEHNEPQNISALMCFRHKPTTGCTIYARSPRVYRGLEDLRYPFHDGTFTVTQCGRICFKGRR